MKKLSSLILALFVSTTALAQFTVQVNSPGIVNLSYGAANDYAIYEPGFEVPKFYVHVWSNAADNSTGTVYDDAWSNSNVEMNWDSSTNSYVGTINLNNKLFTNTNNVFPVGTTVSNLGFVFKDLQVGSSKQSGDLRASDYGFTTTTTVVTLGVSNNLLGKKAVVANGKLFSSIKGNANVSIYEMSGKMISNFPTKNDGNAIDLNVMKSGIYLVKITNGTQTEVVKFVK